MKKLAFYLLLVSFLALCISADFRIVERKSFLHPEYKIIYQEDGTFILNFPPNPLGSNKFERTIVFHEKAFFEFLRALETHMSYSNSLETNKIKPFSKSLGAIKTSKRNSFNDNQIETTTHVSLDGKIRLILEMRSKTFSHMYILTYSEVSSLVDIMRNNSRLDMKKELEKGNKK